MFLLLNEWQFLLLHSAWARTRIFSIISHRIMYASFCCCDSFLFLKKKSACVCHWPFVNDNATNINLSQRLYFFYGDACVRNTNTWTFNTRLCTLHQFHLLCSHLIRIFYTFLAFFWSHSCYCFVFIGVFVSAPIRAYKSILSACAHTHAHTQTHSTAYFSISLDRTNDHLSLVAKTTKNQLLLFLLLFCLDHCFIFAYATQFFFDLILFTF